MPAHQPAFERETVDVGVSPEGYVLRVPSKTAHITCSCGLDTGWIPTPEARRIYRKHLDA